ncbi:MAG: hypothetical protein K8E24_013560 [Methanobacterium paludis]|nr:hypothetical protein [Methanobacterium paludis]
MADNDLNGSMEVIGDSENVTPLNNDPEITQLDQEISLVDTQITILNKKDELSKKQDEVYIRTHIEPKREWKHFKRLQHILNKFYGFKYWSPVDKATTYMALIGIITAGGAYIMGILTGETALIFNVFLILLDKGAGALSTKYSITDQSTDSTYTQSIVSKSSLTTSSVDSSVSSVDESSDSVSDSESILEGV